ncbi:HAD-IIB family hydrolase, partial [Acinetobacter soli]|uniref:HAD-IIB family hydrolase n=1 Tax=Acinetobacter soli TaxID=487316 RepID=UPI00125DA460
MKNKIVELSSNLIFLQNLRDKLSSIYNKPCLFLDIDGTLSDFQLNPTESYIPTKTLNILGKIISKEIPVVAVTGRDIDSARKLFGSIHLPIAALHGLEIYLGNEKKLHTPKNFLEISNIYKILAQACLSYPSL